MKVLSHFSSTVTLTWRQASQRDDQTAHEEPMDSEPEQTENDWTMNFVSHNSSEPDAQQVINKALLPNCTDHVTLYNM